MVGKDPDSTTKPHLVRSLNLPLLVLYGLGVTIGAGIYVLLGATAARAGVHAPISFLVSAFVMAFSAGTFAELAGRYPVSAGEAAYVRQSFRVEWLAGLVGMVVVVEATVAAATISLGSIGYLGVFVPLPDWTIITLVVLAMGAIASLGTLQSVGFAAALTLIEVAGLLVIIFGGFSGDSSVLARLPEIIPNSLDTSIMWGVASAGLLAFFAFIGFEDMVNVAEETKNPSRTLPIAIFTTLGLVTVLYFLVSTVSVLSVPLSELETSSAPLTLVFSSVTGLPSEIITLIAIVATLNGVIIQIIMGSRVIYGLAAKGNLPSVLGRVNARTKTPLIATALIVALVLVLGLSFELAALAEVTSQATLAIFILINLALIRLKLTGRAPETVWFTVPVWVPVVGVVLSTGLLLIGFL